MVSLPIIIENIFTSLQDIWKTDSVFSKLIDPKIGNRKNNRKLVEENTP